VTDHRDEHEPYGFTFDPPKDISDAALRLSQDIAQRLNQVWRACPDKDVRFVLVHHDEWDRCTQLTREAAEEITKLRRRCEMEASHIAELKEQVRTIALERDAAREKAARIMEGLEGCCMTCEPVGMRNQQMERDIETLKDQRDEARRLYCCLCELHRLGDGTAEAAKRGWDCFKDSPMDRLAKLDEELGL
jgi:hypothetical protein